MLEKTKHKQHRLFTTRLMSWQRRVLVREGQHLISKREAREIIALEEEIATCIVDEDSLGDQLEQAEVF